MRFVVTSSARWAWAVVGARRSHLWTPAGGVRGGKQDGGLVPRGATGGIPRVNAVGIVQSCRCPIASGGVVAGQKVRTSSPLDLIGSRDADYTGANAAAHAATRSARASPASIVIFRYSARTLRHAAVRSTNASHALLKSPPISIPSWWWPWPWRWLPWALQARPRGACEASWS